MRELSNLSVCFLAGTLGRGGAERQLIYMLRALADANILTRVLCLTRGESLEAEIKALGVPVEWVGASNSRPVRLATIIQALRRRPADIVQSAHFYTNLYAAVAARVLGFKEIGAIRSDLRSELRDKGSLGWGQLNAPRHLIANSVLAQQRAIANGIKPGQIDLVRNAVESPQVNGRRAQGEQETVHLVFAGRLVEPKRPDRFLRVLSKVIKQLPEQNVRARIAGNGPLKDLLLTQAGKLGLGADRLEFLGEVENMASIYREADLLVLTSDWEGTPNVVLEAMAWGLPVVASCVGGLPEIIGDNRGLLVPPDHEDEMAALVVRLVLDKDLRQRLGKSAHDYVARYHSLGALKEHLTTIYAKVLSR